MNNHEIIGNIASAIAKEVSTYMWDDEKLTVFYYPGSSVLELRKWNAWKDELLDSWQLSLGGKFLKISDEANMNGFLRAFVVAYNYAIEQVLSALEYAEGIVEKEMEEA